MNDQQYTREMNRRMLRCLLWLARRFVEDMGATLRGLR
jgi:hypothetical protein